LPVARESDENVHLERQSAAVLFQGIAIIVPLISMADFFQVPRQLLFCGPSALPDGPHFLCGQ